MMFELRPDAKGKGECIGMEKKGICPKRNVSVNMASENHFLQIRVSFPLPPPPPERGDSVNLRKYLLYYLIQN